MKGSCVIIIIHLQIAAILFHNFFYALDPKPMPSSACFMRNRQSILRIHRSTSTGIDEYDNQKRRTFFFCAVNSIKESGMFSAASTALSSKLQNSDVSSCRKISCQTPLRISAIKVICFCIHCLW